MNELFNLIDKLRCDHYLDDTEYMRLLEGINPDLMEYAAVNARQVCEAVYGDKVFVRGLVEFTNYCKNDCLYCGIRCSNGNADRYRLSDEQILDCCDEGYELGFRTFVLQGGEDGAYSDDRLCSLLGQIKEHHPDCAVTLSVGERSYESYKRLFEAGADRYLLRHETADREHYSKLHTKSQSFENRMKCLFDLKKIGYQVGCGFMVGSPYQSISSIVEDLKFIKSFEPHMVGIGPFIPHKDTPFGDMKAGTVDITLFLLSIIRLMLPAVLLPATTALGTLDPRGREKGLMAGANVVMPNLSPVATRKKYELYDNKICTGEESAQCIKCLENRVTSVGRKIVVDRGDHADASV